MSAEGRWKQFDTSYRKITMTEFAWGEKLKYCHKKCFWPLTTYCTINANSTFMFGYFCVFFQTHLSLCSRTIYVKQTQYFQSHRTLLSTVMILTENICFIHKRLFVFKKEVLCVYNHIERTLRMIFPLLILTEQSCSRPQWLLSGSQSTFTDRYKVWPTRLSFDHQVCRYCLWSSLTTIQHRKVTVYTSIRLHAELDHLTKSSVLNTKPEPGNSKNTRFWSVFCLLQDRIWVETLCITSIKPFLFVLFSFVFFKRCSVWIKYENTKDIKWLANRSHLQLQYNVAQIETRS